MPTTNPVPSNDPTDLLFNAQKLDQVVSGSAQYYTDRLGVNRRTVEGISAAADVVLAGLGYAPPVAYVAGISLTLATQTVEYAGEVYAPKVADLPFTTSGTFETAKFRLIQGVAATDLAASGGSAMIGHLPAGTGAVATTVQSKMREFVSVKDFGAVGDGVADDTAAIQAAIDYLNPNVWAASFNYQQGGGTVFLPRGVYRITSPINLAPFVTLEGVGCDGWTGGGAGIGLTSGASPANGSAIFADFGATVETCAIDTQNWSVSGGTLYAATNQTLITVGQLGGTYTYCQGSGLRKLAIFCTNNTRVGVRLQGAALMKIEDISIMGFKVSLVSNCVWCSEYRNIFSISSQVGIAQVTNNEVRVSGVFDLEGWGTSNGTTITNNNVVTAGNKPSFWSANDTNYNGTSIYVVDGFTLHYENVTAQHCGRAFYAEAADVTFGTVYIEDLPYLGTDNASTPGAFNGYNASAGNRSLLINHLHCDSNGVTLFNNLTNFPVTLLNFSGIQGRTLGTTVSGSKLLIGNNVNRNGAFGDYRAATNIINIVPETGTWTPALTSISGTGVTATGKWNKRGNVYDCCVTISGTGITATGGGASNFTTFYDGVVFPPPTISTAAAVATANLQVCGCGHLSSSTALVYIPAITSTTQIVVTFQYYAA